MAVGERFAVLPFPRRMARHRLCGSNFKARCDSYRRQKNPLAKTLPPRYGTHQTARSDGVEFLTFQLEA
jgi:hypothetical protein